jgi:hypothetical protein
MIAELNRAPRIEGKEHQAMAGLVDGRAERLKIGDAVLVLHKGRRRRCGGLNVTPTVGLSIH